MNEQLEKSEQIPTPSTLDLVKIDAKWGQVVATGGRYFSVRFFDNGEVMDIQIERYSLVKIIDKSVKRLLESGVFPKEEFKKVIWDSDNIGNDLASLVTVFGEYEAKKL